MEVPIGGDRWHASQIEGGVIVTLEGSVGSYTTGETDKLRTESEIVAYARQKKHLNNAINERQGHIASKKQEIEQIERMVAMPVHAEDFNLQQKLTKFRHELEEMHKAVAYWENELAPIDETLSALHAKLENAKQKMTERFTRTWKLMDDQEIEVTIRAYQA